MAYARPSRPANSTSKAAIEGHHHGAHLTASEEKRSIRLEMLRGRVLQKSHDVVHMDFAIHTSNYKAGRESWKVLSMPDNASTQYSRRPYLCSESKAQHKG